MYNPSAFRIEDRETLHAFIARFGFATLITNGTADAEPAVTHLPLMIEPDRGRLGTLIGHFARANPHWQPDHSASRSVAVFHGPHAFVSPAWYRSSAPAVPTWNYAVVHAAGRLSLIQDVEHTRRIVHALHRQYEPTPAPRQNEPSFETETKMLGAIVAFEMPIDRIEGKFKLSQNRDRLDPAGAIEQLEAQGDPDAQRLAAFARTHLHLPRE